MPGKRLKAAPTKNTLLNLKRQLAFLDDGHSQLERKRELLTRLVYQRIGEYREIRDKAHDAIKLAYHWLSMLQLRMSSRALHQVALGVKPALELKILPRRNLGVEYPSVTGELQVAAVTGGELVGADDGG